MRQYALGSLDRKFPLIESGIANNFTKEVDFSFMPKESLSVGIDAPAIPITKSAGNISEAPVNDTVRIPVKVDKTPVVTRIVKPTVVPVKKTAKPPVKKINTIGVDQFRHTSGVNTDIPIVPAPKASPNTPSITSKETVKRTATPTTAATSKKGASFGGTVALVAGALIVGGILLAGKKKKGMAGVKAKTRSKVKTQNKTQKRSRAKVVQGSI